MDKVETRMGAVDMKSGEMGILPFGQTSGRDRRGDTRHRLMLKMTVATISGAFPGLATNISRGGLCVMSRRPVPTESQVQLHISFPAGPEGGISGPLQAQSCWSRAIELGDQPLYDTGYRFTDINPKTQDILTSYLDTLPPLDD